MKLILFRKRKFPLAPGERGGPARLRAFTLIELLTVISIIGLLAGLLVGLAPMATRKMKEARMRSELSQLVSLIEDYKSELGFYPPDNPGPVTNKWRNPLFYELCGTVFQGGKFQTLDRTEAVDVEVLKTQFGVSGISNSKRDPKQVAFSHNFKASQFKEFLKSPDIELLVAPLPGPEVAGVKELNPWYYDSSSRNRNNPNGFDLWAYGYIGRRLYIFSNWSREPIPVE